jgi:hypothetical protein
MSDKQSKKKKNKLLSLKDKVTGGGAEPAPAAADPPARFSA